jgi:hypothetical protein
MVALQIFESKLENQKLGLLQQLKIASFTFQTLIETQIQCKGGGMCFAQSKTASTEQVVLSEVQWVL